MRGFGSDSSYYTAMLTEKAPLDGLASFALTVLDDPGGLPEPWAAELERAERRAVDPDDDPRASLAVSFLNRIINTVNPAEIDRSNAGTALTVLGRHIEDVRERIEIEQGNAEGADETAYHEADEHITRALDELDIAIAALAWQEEDDPE